MKNSWQRANRKDERKRRVPRVWRRVTRVRNSDDKNKDVGNEEGGWRPTSEAMNREKYGIGHYTVLLLYLCLLYAFYVRIIIVYILMQSK